MRRRNNPPRRTSSLHQRTNPFDAAPSTAARSQQRRPDRSSPSRNRRPRSKRLLQRPLHSTGRWGNATNTRRRCKSKHQLNSTPRALIPARATAAATPTAALRGARSGGPGASRVGTDLATATSQSRHQTTGGSGAGPSRNRNRPTTAAMAASLPSLRHPITRSDRSRPPSATPMTPPGYAPTEPPARQRTLGL